MPRTLSRTARRGLNESDTTRNPRLRFGSRAQLPVARLLGPHRRSALAGRFITLTQTQQTPPPRPRTTPSRRSWFRRGCERVRDEARHAWCGRYAVVRAGTELAPACQGGASVSPNALASFRAGLLRRSPPERNAGLVRVPAVERSAAGSRSIETTSTSSSTRSTPRARTTHRSHFVREPDAVLLEEPQSPC
jgi:hypothetical protein